MLQGEAVNFEEGGAFVLQWLVLTEEYREDLLDM